MVSGLSENLRRLGVACLAIVTGKMSDSKQNTPHARVEKEIRRKSNTLRALRNRSASVRIPPPESGATTRVTSPPRPLETLWQIASEFCGDWLSRSSLVTRP